MYSLGAYMHVCLCVCVHVCVFAKSFTQENVNCHSFIH